MKRKIIKIAEENCNGCGLCLPNCPEGAIQIIDNRARLISDIFCDGLGACLGHCPTGAITIEEREAEPYDERKVMEQIIKQGDRVILAHLEHLKEHGETTYLYQAHKALKDMDIPIPKQEKQMSHHNHPQGGCPGAKAMQLQNQNGPNEVELGVKSSQLRNWPLQMHLISPQSPVYANADVLLSADCVAHALGDFHNSHLKNKALAIACPKLDQNTEIYIDKLMALIDESHINTLTVMTMEVPCCSGLLRLAKTAASSAKRKMPLKSITVSLHGELLNEEWV